LQYLWSCRWCGWAGWQGGVQGAKCKVQISNFKGQNAKFRVEGGRAAEISPRWAFDGGGYSGRRALPWADGGCPGGAREDAIARGALPMPDDMGYCLPGLWPSLLRTASRPPLRGFARLKFQPAPWAGAHGFIRSPRARLRRRGDRWWVGLMGALDLR